LEEADIVFLMIDAEEGLTDQDKKICALAAEKGRGIILVLNKWDMMPDIKNTFEAVSDRMRFMFGHLDYAPIIPVSAKNGNGVEQLLNTAVKMYRQLTTHIDTGPLNKALEQWLVENPPPVGPQTRFKIRYATQVTDNPIKFVFFASRPEAVASSYQSYLKNKIRKDLGFSMIPIEIGFRGSRKDPTTVRKELEVKRRERNEKAGGKQRGK
jgi:GTP-binding protein